MSQAVDALEARLGYRFADESLLELALTHASHSYEHDGTRGNERLEFLGDAVLDLAVAQLLYEAHPDWNEGELTRARKAHVNAVTLAERARDLELGEWVKLGRGEQRGGGADKPRILACLFEAILGAIYLDGGLEPVVELVRRELGPQLAQGAAVPHHDAKTRLQEWAQASFKELPHYKTTRDSGVENDDERFSVDVLIGADAWGSGTGRSKRQAEHAAAEAALARIDEQQA